MAITPKLYGRFAVNALKGGINWQGDTIRAMLVGQSYTPDQDAHEFKSSVTGEITGTGYTAGGKALTGKTVAYDATTNQARIDADDVVWTGATISAWTVVLYKDTGNAATSPLVGYYQSDSAISSTNDDFTVAWDSLGIGYIAAS